MRGLDLDKGLTSNTLRAIHQRHQQRSDHVSSPQFDTLGIAQMYPTGSQFSNFSSTGKGCSYGRFGHIPSLDSLNGYITDLPGNSNLFSGLSQERLTFNVPRDVERVSCMLDEISKSGKEDQQFHNVVLGLEEKAISNSGHACNEMVSSGGFIRCFKEFERNGTSGCEIPQKNDNCSNAKVGGLSDVLMSLESENNLLPRQVMLDDLHEPISPQHDDGVDLMVSDIDIDAYQLDDIHTFSDQV